MYLLVVRKRDGRYDGRTKKTTWGQWRQWGIELYPTKKELTDRLSGRYRYVGDENEEFEVKYYKVDEDSCRTLKTSVILEEVK